MAQIWHTLPPPLENPPTAEDVRNDPDINTTDPLFYQIVGNPKYEWLSNRFIQLSRILGQAHWSLPVYDGDELSIGRDYDAIYRNLVCTNTNERLTLMVKMTRLLLWQEIEEALLSIGRDEEKDVTWFFQREQLKQEHTRQKPFGTIDGVFYGQTTMQRRNENGRSVVPCTGDPVMGTGLDPTNRWGVERHAGGGVDLMACCGQPVGLTRGCWIQMDANVEWGQIVPYEVWYSGNGAEAVLSNLARDENDNLTLDNVGNYITKTWQIGTAFLDSTYYKTLHNQIQTGLNNMKPEMGKVYTKVSDHLDERIDNPSLPLINLYLWLKGEMPNVLSALQQVVSGVDLYNYAQDVCLHPPRTEIEWERRINSHIFAVEMGPTYFTEEVRNFARLIGVDERVKLMKPGVFDVNVINTLIKVLTDAVVAANKLDGVVDELEMLGDRIAMLIGPIQNAMNRIQPLLNLFGSVRDKGKIDQNIQTDIEAYREFIVGDKLERNKTIVWQRALNKVIKLPSKNSVLDIDADNTAVEKLAVKSVSFSKTIDGNKRVVEELVEFEKLTRSVLTSKPNAVDLIVFGLPVGWKEQLEDIVEQSVDQSASLGSRFGQIDAVVISSIYLEQDKLMSLFGAFNQNAKIASLYTSAPKNEFVLKEVEKLDLENTFNQLVVAGNAFKTSVAKYEIAFKKKAEETLDEMVANIEQEYTELVLFFDPQTTILDAIDALENTASNTGIELSNDQRKLIDNVRTFYKESIDAMEEAELAKMEEEERKKKEAEKKRIEEEDARRNAEKKRLKEEQARKEEEERVRKEEQEKRKGEDERLKQIRDWVKMPLSTPEQRVLFSEKSFSALSDLQTYITVRRSKDKQFDTQFAQLIVNANNVHGPGFFKNVAGTTIPRMIHYDSTMKLIDTSDSYSGIYLGKLADIQTSKYLQTTMSSLLDYFTFFGTTGQDEKEILLASSLIDIQKLPEQPVLVRRVLDDKSSVDVSDVKRDFLKLKPLLVNGKDNNQLLSMSFQKWERNSCWMDSLYSAMFSIPEAGVSDILFETEKIRTPVLQLVFPNNRIEALDVNLRGCSDTRVKEMHRGLLSDLKDNQDPSEMMQSSCRLIDKWLDVLDCVAAVPKVSSGREQNPGETIEALISVYNLEKTIRYVNRWPAADFEKIQQASVANNGDFDKFSDDLKRINIEKGTEPYLFINLNDIPQLFTTIITKGRIQVPLMENGYVLSGIISSTGAHFTAHTFDFLKKQWAYFDNKAQTTGHLGKKVGWTTDVFALLDQNGLSIGIFDIETGYSYAEDINRRKFKLSSLVYTSEQEVDRLLLKKNMPLEAQRKKEEEQKRKDEEERKRKAAEAASLYSPFIDALEKNDTARANELIRELKSPQKEYVLMGLHKAGLINLQMYAGIVAEELELALTASDEEGIAIVNRLLLVTSPELVKGVKQILNITN